MRLIPSDPDIKTIVNRIIDGDINLQPNFQRGEVWGEAKKIRLIDSILREWHVPPIHVVEIKETGRQDVLDGQQRLVAIRDFVNGEICIDGSIEPLDDQIGKLDGFTYKKLPEFWKRKFDKFTIRMYSITDYLPSEPGELFYRLNQPTNLTSAEQRNAFFGPAREQVKNLVELFESFRLTRKELGFSNSRMAYDDVVARLCVYLENEKLTEKITASVLADRYRSEEGFNSITVSRARNAIKFLSTTVEYFDDYIKFNKATLLSWLIFLTQLDKHPISRDYRLIGEFIYTFEASRNNIKKEYTNFTYSYEMTSDLFTLFSDRSSSRVADVSSVLIRDFIIWAFFHEYTKNLYVDTSIEKLFKVKIFLETATRSMDMQDMILEYIQNCEWGHSL